MSTMPTPPTPTEAAPGDHGVRRIRVLLGSIVLCIGVLDLIATLLHVFGPPSAKSLGFVHSFLVMLIGGSILLRGLRQVQPKV